jgi:hypothetical protein
MGFIHPVDACNLAEASDDCLYCQLFYHLPTFSPTYHIMILLLSRIHVLENRCHWAFVAYVVLARILFKVFCVFVNSIISQVHEQIVQVWADWGIVSGSCKTS